MRKFLQWLGLSIAVGGGWLVATYIINRVTN